MRRGRAGGLAGEACWLLLLMLVADAAALVQPVEKIAPEICPTIDIRSSPEQLNKLRGCRVIEGQLNIVLMERAKPKDFENISFPELREVTGYINIYRLRGMRNLGDLFPNLTVVRGMQLFKDYSIIIFDNEQLEVVGLRSLAKVERGLVRIENNDHLCYADTIDWSQIVANGYADSNIIRANYDPRLCGLCPKSQSRTEDRRQSRYCPVDATGKILCWDEKHCQKVCPTTCGERACSGNLTCCHPTCLGGCDGPTAHDCHACKNFSLGYSDQRKCVERCPAGFYQLFRRCVTEQECRSMQPPLLLGSASQKNTPTPKIPFYKLLNNYKCVYVCPSGYIEKGDDRTATCEPCPASGCRRDCRGDSIDSVQTAEQFRGCTHIQGSLEISLRTGGVNTMSVLEDSLGEIQEIDGALRVTRSYPLVSLMFLKNLERIVGINDTNNNKNHSLYIFNNANLELLWDWSLKKPVEIIRGGVFIHFNPKLCYNQVLPIKNMTKDPRATFTEYDVNNNGDQGSCLQDKLHLRVHILKPTAAILTWDMYCVEDIRKLLGYSIYYISAETNVTLYGQRDACSDTWNVLDKTVEEVRNTTVYPITKNGIIMNNCDLVQPLFYPVTQLVPYTRYAAYVKTYTTYQDKDGAQSPIIYFRTLPGAPSPPQGLTVESLSPNSVYIKWSPPSMPNGTIILYHVEIQQNSYNQPKIMASNINHCGSPSILANKIALHNEEQTEKQEKDNNTGDVKEGSCSCEKEDTKPITRFSSRVEAERAETILFENDLQNSVYIRTPDRKKIVLNRTRRSIDDDLNSMLVILGKNNGRQQLVAGLNYTNSTDDESYAKNLYYELSGKTRSIVVDHMRHFTWYTVNIWACREKHPNETVEGYNESWCSQREHHTFLTMELPNADVVSNVRAEIVPSNKTVPEVNVTWDPPKHPNGFVLAYNVHHSLVDANIQSQDVGLQTCVPAEDYELNGRAHVMRQLAPGNYSVTVTPITVSGAGNVSAQVYVFIPERSIETGYEWVWGLIGGCVIILAVAGAGVWYARRSLLSSAETNKLFASVNPEYVSSVYVPDEWEVPRANIELIRELGQGSFGMVYEGIAKNLEKGKPETRCAVKTVNEHATDRERIDFLNEASVMKAFDTHHVVRLMGVVSRGQPTFVVMELMQHGDLKTYLRSHRPDNDSSLPKKDPAGAPPTLQAILQMAIEIADGMAYLSAKKYVHRDLAARNCMVAGDMTVKVGDFGMTRDIYETDYYRKGTKGLLPVRWMSPESLKDGVFSSSSDAWSYGVVLWEMATLAMQPYQGLSNEQVVRYVVEGGVMERPEHCPDRLYELMRLCWAHRASGRPSFLQLVAELAASSQPHFRQRSFFHSPMGQELYAMQRINSTEEEAESGSARVGALGSGSGLFGVSGRLPSWVRELSLRSRTSPDAAAEPLQPLPRKPPPNGRVHTTPC